MKQEPNMPPEWLAAYADGETDRNAALAPLKMRVEALLVEHPDARADIEEQGRLQELVQHTASVEPEAAAWAGVLARLQDAPRHLGRRRVWSWRGLATMLAVTAAALWLISFLPTSQPNEAAKLPDEDSIFAVATADEIEILSIEGDATSTLVVGEAPVFGPLELLQAGEMKVTRVEPDAPRNRLDVCEGPAAPMIWALLDSER